ncbi:MAG: hypothetical protein A2Z29_00930 [Chloroflexi bacterium RBG_16_56_11]|nr:MAG: hypothetical protein A2Z29_00930 [Chloroflexi bacterium RBG_16_56_11]
MELKEYVGMEFDGLERILKRVTDGLDQEEIIWRPACGCNSIGLILFHVARSEDSFVQARLRNKPEVWETGKWYTKLNVAENEAGAHYTMEQVNAFPVPRLEDLMAYYSAVRAQTVAYLKTMTAAGFDKKVTMPRFGEMPAAAIFSIIVSHTSQHIGEISYLRGLQRGMDK